MAKKKVNSPRASSRKPSRKSRTNRRTKIAPASAYATSIWDRAVYSAVNAPAAPDLIADAEARLDVRIPESMKRNLLVQNGGYLIHCESYPFDEDTFWTNAAVGGFFPVQSWQPATENHWFQAVEDVDGLERLICIAAHSESQLCLDYRRSGRQGVPGVTYVDVCRTPTEVTVVTQSVDDFINALVAARPDEDDE